MAQAVDPALQQAVSAALPPSLVIYLPLVVIIIGGLGRFAKAKKNGLSNLDAFLTLFNGANTPLLIACLCMLSLTSCATAAAIATSPFGRAVIDTSDQLAKQVVLTTEETGLEQIILQAAAKVSALNAEGVNSDIVKETLRLSEIAGFKAVINAAQDKYQALTGNVFTLPKNPINVTPAKMTTADAVPDCMQTAPRIPDYGYRVAFMLSTADVK